MKAIDQIRTSGCPVAFALDVMGDRWSLLIIRDIMIAKKRTYSEFIAMDEHIASNILNDRLKKLTQSGIATKSRDPESHRSFVYQLTQKGADLAPILIEMIAWSGKHDTRELAKKDVLNSILEDRLSFEKMARGQ